MRVTCFGLALVLSMAAATAPSARAGVVQHYSSHGRQAIAPGVEHDWGTAEASNGNQRVQIVEVTSGTAGIGFETSLAQDRITARETTSSQALRQSREGHRVVTAINGSTFNSWPSGKVSARGLNVRFGELLTSGTNANLSFAVDSDGRPQIGRPSLTVEMTMPDGSVATINRVNQGRMPDETVLYTPRFGGRTWTDDAGTEVVIEGGELPLAPHGTYAGTVVNVRRGVGDVAIGRGQLVVSATGAGTAALQSIAVGDEVTIELTIEEGWRDVTHAVGGRELLVRQGREQIEPYRTTLVNAANPRTAIGVTADGRVLLVIVDGRSSTSGGVTMHELAELLIERGAVSGVNLDGGGSSTLAVRTPGDVEVGLVNTPSDGQERTVATTLQVVSSIPTGPLATLLVRPRQAALYAGQQQQFRAKGHDDAFNAVPINPAAVTWQAPGPEATVDANGLLTAVAAGELELRARHAGREATAAVTVMADEAAPNVTRPTASMMTGPIGTETVPLKLSWSATDTQGSVVSIELEQSVNGGGWAPVPLPAGSATQIVRQIAPGVLHRFRVRATDSAGNTSAWSGPAGFTLIVHQETSSAITRQGTWLLLSKSGTLGGSFLRSNTTGASLRLAFHGAQVGWVTNRGPKMGRADVYTDGTYAGRLDLQASSFKPRRMRYVSPLTASMARTIELRNASPPTRPKVDLDAFIVLLPEPAQ